MKAAGWIGIGVVGLLGGVLASTLFWSGQGGSEPGPGIDAAGDPVVMTPVGASRDRPTPGPSTAAPDRAAAAPTLPTEGLGPELLSLHPGYEAAMDRTVSLAELPESGPPQEVDKIIATELMGLVAEVQGAAEAHLTYAETAPRAQATIATDRAAQLYQHLSEAILEVPMAPGLPAAQVQVQRLTRERMAEEHARRAALLRAQGG